ncbi:hypothetical protein QR77_01370 [Streptomyces sp. 150FB]|uniref:hypothetical protein n=1 Tax=Streptomyces sp. 150FB TaxID=1576605 RepID=UPI0005891AA2|nr:hypothetical protein [Streptomyces sp. 150FB]KIF73008.1 hypothetical protein QR77_01370 [Streptomyces sp. 150FB]
MTVRGTVRRTLLVAAEVAAWWVALFVLWLMLISTVDTLEVIVGASVALLGALGAWRARRAVAER